MSLWVKSMSPGIPLKIKRKYPDVPMGHGAVFRLVRFVKLVS
jgi:hypothetical protein